MVSRRSVLKMTIPAAAAIPVAVMAASDKPEMIGFLRAFQRCRRFQAMTAI